MFIRTEREEEAAPVNPERVHNAFRCTGHVWRRRSKLWCLLPSLSPGGGSERLCSGSQPATLAAAADMVMKSRAHAGSKKVAAFCTLVGCRLPPFDGAARPFGVGS